MSDMLKEAVKHEVPYGKAQSKDKLTEHVKEEAKPLSGGDTDVLASTLVDLDDRIAKLEQYEKIMPLLEGLVNDISFICARNEGKRALAKLKEGK